MYTRGGVPDRCWGARVGIIEVSQATDNVDETLDQLLALFQIGVPVSVLIAALGGYALAARTLSRVDRITDLARTLSADDLSGRLNLPHTDDEVGRLARTFDTMLERLEEAFLRDTQFTSDALHELRTPLAAMRTILDTTRVKRRSVDDYERALDDLAGETDRLQSLVADLLALARGNVSAAPGFEMLDLSALLFDVADSLRPLAEEKALGLTCDVPPGLEVRGDRDQLVRLFVNLVDNAIKFTEQGQVCITAERRLEQEVAVVISDTGSGITPAHLPHVFERFYRADPARSAGGSGLGLTLARSITRAHGGTIEITSSPERGTQVTVLLRCP